MPFKALLIIIFCLCGCEQKSKAVNQKVESSPIKIAIANLSRVRSEAKIFQEINALIDKEHEKAQKEIVNIETQLRQEYQSLQEKSHKINKKDSPELIKQNQVFQAKVADLEQKVQQEKERLNRKFESLQKKAEDALTIAIEQIVKEQNIKMVLNTSVLNNEVVVSADKSLNLTDQLISRLDKILTNINDELPKNS